MSKVALIRCETYNYKDVKEAVKRGVELLGGINRFAKKGEKILLKPNLLAADPPEKCVTTHPSVFRAVAELFLTTGAKISYGDSPAFGSTAGAAKKAGLAEVADKLEIKIGDFKNGEKIFFDKGKQNRKFIIARAVLENDAVVSLPKLKSHGFEKFTGAIKNQFGCIPGMLKGEYHVKIPDPCNFAKMLVDLNNFVNPRLYIMDGIYGMEGNGPRGGTPKQMNILLFSEDPVALDATVCRLINLDPEFVPTTKFGMEYGMGTYLENEIEITGDDLDRFKNEGFDINRFPLKTYNAKGFTRFLNNRLVPKPYIVENECIKCGICVNMCPVNPKAVDWFKGDKGNVPVYNYDNCIRCYCCQEMCPESAIKLKAPLLRRIFNK
ncbi:MAG: DUF362 domain-containing protein [Spirochaetes bacterium]|nr:DUF362 domain-containing protein [Spirochaetota bacterium]